VNSFEKARLRAVPSYDPQIRASAPEGSPFQRSRTEDGTARIQHSIQQIKLPHEPVMAEY
jgi:hypothetical protein